jgi:hypothetical protein
MKRLPPSSGKWEEERLLIWHMLGELHEQQELSEASEKQQIGAAHTKIRDLEGKLAAMQSWKWKAWGASAAAAYLAAMVVELVRLLFARH